MRHTVQCEVHTEFTQTHKHSKRVINVINHTQPSAIVIALKWTTMNDDTTQLYKTDVITGRWTNVLSSDSFARLPQMGQEPTCGHISLFSCSWNSSMVLFCRMNSKSIVFDWFVGIRDVCKLVWMKTMRIGHGGGWNNADADVDEDERCGRLGGLGWESIRNNKSRKWIDHLTDHTFVNWLTGWIGGWLRCAVATVRPR